MNWLKYAQDVISIITAALFMIGFGAFLVLMSFFPSIANKLITKFVDQVYEKVHYQ